MNNLIKNITATQASFGITHPAFRYQQEGPHMRAFLHQALNDQAVAA
ncbi:hypothetical protein [Ectopseudomonas oleovorans]|uniref:Uncharacterized protein n=2 Tax=Ectopseudomonas oleovorans TaxID=301 RepID=A0A1H7DQD6_ECTOL